MVDRFAELKTGQDFGAADIELAEQGNGNQSSFMKSFFNDVGVIKEKMGTLKKIISEISILHDKSMTQVVTKKPEEDKELDNYMDQANSLGLDIKNRLKRLDDSNKKIEGLTPAEVRIRTNMHGALSRQFVDMMKDYQDKQEAYKGKIRDKVKRQIQIVKPEGVNEEAMEEYLQGKKQIFTDVIIGTQVNQAYEDIQARHREILKLEESLRELHQLFVDMAVLVESQGELLDQIEAQVNSAVGYTEKGVVELQKANEYQKKSRKKMCYIIICFIIIIVIVLVVGLTAVKSA